MTTYLYRAVATEYVDDAFTNEPIAWPGSPLGRASGYLSRSSAVDAGVRSGVAFEVLRSEPVVFLSRSERIQKQINELHQQLAEISLTG